MSRNYKMINYAANQARLSTMLFKHGAVISRGSKIITAGHNTIRTHFMNKNETSMHAEMNTILKYCNNILHINVDLRKKHFNIRKLNKCILWVVRISKNNHFTESKPCKSCLDVLIKLGIKKIGYTDRHSNIILVNTNALVSNHLTNAQRYIKRITDL